MGRTSGRPNDERALLLLGLMQAEDRYGYELQNFIEHNLGGLIELKRATAYQLLDRLARHGCVESRVEQHGPRPARTVYRVTEEGRRHFRQLVHRYLREAAPLRAPGTIALMFLDHLPAGELLPALIERRHQSAAYLAQLAEIPVHQRAVGAELALSRARALVSADVAWLDATIARLRRETPEA